MKDDSKAAILINELDTIGHLIEDMPAAPEYTDAQIAIQKAKALIAAGRARLHEEGIRKRYDV